MKTLREVAKYYLDTGAKVRNKKDGSIKVLDELLLSSDSFSNYEIIAHDLSDLTKEIEVNGERFVPVVKLEEMKEEFYIQARQLQEDQRWLNQTSFLVIEKLLSWHFDVFGLIESGEAINVNDLEDGKV